MILSFQILMIWWVLPLLVISCAVIIQLFLFHLFIDRILFIKVPDNTFVVFLLQEPGLSSGKDTFSHKCPHCRWILAVCCHGHVCCRFGTVLYCHLLESQETNSPVLFMHKHKIHEKKEYLGTTGSINIPAIWRENQRLFLDVFDRLPDQVPRWWQWGTTMARQHHQGKHPSVSRLETLSNCWREIPTPPGGRYLTRLPLHKLCPALPWKYKRV